MKVRSIILSLIMILACLGQAMHYAQVEEDLACESSTLHFCSPEHHHHCGLCDFVFTPISLGDLNKTEITQYYSEVNYLISNQNSKSTFAAKQRSRAPPLFKLT